MTDTAATREIIWGANAISQKAVTPADDADLPEGACRALEVVTAGDVVCIAANDADTEIVTRAAVAAGTIIQVQVRRVMAATTATVIALY